jgi:hypothetical protein
MTPKTLSMAAWWLATADQGKHEAMARIASYLPSLLSNPQLPQTPSTQLPSIIHIKSAVTLKSKRKRKQAARTGTPVVERVYKGLQPPEATTTMLAQLAADPMRPLDHRSVCRLAWAFASSGVKDKAAWRVICEAATSSLGALLQVMYA